MQEARAQLYRFFSGVFREPPTQDFLSGLLSDRGLEMIKGLSPGHEAVGELSALIGDVRSGKYTLEDFQSDFEGLIRVPGVQYVQPYESAYRQQQAPGKGRCKTTLLGEPAYQVAQIYQNAGLEPTAEAIPFPDELTVELEFMSRLCARAAKGAESGDAMKAKDVTAMQRDFLAEHILPWVPSCLTKITKEAVTPLYRILAKLLNAFLDTERKVAGAPDAATGSSR